MTDDGDVVATHMMHEERGSTTATDRYVVRESVFYWDVAEYGGCI